VREFGNDGKKTSREKGSRGKEDLLFATEKGEKRISLRNHFWDVEKEFILTPVVRQTGLKGVISGKGGTVQWRGRPPKMEGRSWYHKDKSGDGRRTKSRARKSEGGTTLFCTNRLRVSEGKRKGRGGNKGKGEKGKAAKGKNSDKTSWTTALKRLGRFRPPLFRLRHDLGVKTGEGGERF